MECIAPKTRMYWLEMNENILNSGFKDFQRFLAHDTKAYVNGALPVKTKKLMGLVGSAVKYQSCYRGVYRHPPLEICF